jgi:hypothetical protein
MGTPIRLSYAQQLDKALTSPPGSAAEASIQALARMHIAAPGGQGGALAASLLMKPQASRALEAVDAILARQGFPLGEPLGAGGEAAVFGSGDHVVKISADPFNAGPYYLPDIPGVAPYVYADRAGPFRIGVQPRAAEVASPAMMAADPNNYRMWRDRAGVLSDAMARQGFRWDDAGPHNLGIMPAGSMAVIDGWLRPDKGVEYRRARERYPTTEDAIRALLVRPQ